MHLLTPAQAGKRLGGLKASAVIRLIREGRLGAKVMPIRPDTGTKPRRYIPETELERFMRELPDAVQKKPERKRRSAYTLPTKLAEEMKGLVEYE